MNDDFSAVLRTFSPISLQAMERVTLLDRVDRKYIVAIDDLLPLLSKGTSRYRILQEPGGSGDGAECRAFTYENLYLDTPGFSMYFAHHNGRSVRHKVRLRRYMETGAAFAEVKKKEKGRTVKTRLELEGSAFMLNEYLEPARYDRVIGEFIQTHSPFAATELIPAAANSFTRFTLVGSDLDERVTVDTSIAFASPANLTVWVPLQETAVVEVKSAGSNRDSFLRSGLRLAGYRPQGMSKYCVGMALLYPDMKYNCFKPTFREITKRSVSDAAS